MLEPLAFVLPLGLDSLAAAAAMGATRETAVWQRLRIPVVLVIFEGMPLIGLVLGSVLAAASARSPATWQGRKSATGNDRRPSSPTALGAIFDFGCIQSSTFGETANPG